LFTAKASEKNKLKFQNYFLLYHGGWVVAMLLDEDIRTRSNGEKSLEDLMRWMHRNFPRHEHLPGDLKARIGEFVDYYKTARYQESLNNLAPEDVYTGRGQAVLNRRRIIKQKTLERRRRLYGRQKAA
jgi:predicted metalloprotease with PDZ domain